MLTLFRRKERKAVSARNDTCQAVRAAMKDVVPASSRESYCTMQDLIDKSKLEAPPAPTTIMTQLKKLPDDPETSTWTEHKVLAIHIPQEFYESYVDNRSQSVVSIFRIPKFLKELKMKAYVPQIVSLGPYHSNTAQLFPMDYHKRRALYKMRIRFNNSRRIFDPDMDFNFCAFKKILQDENTIRSCYEEKVNFD